MLCVLVLEKLEKIFQIKVKIKMIDVLFGNVLKNFYIFRP
jgi:hypothetical protein